MKLVKKVNLDIVKKVNLDIVKKNKLFSLFLLDRGVKLKKKKKVSVLKTIPIGVGLAYNTVLYRVGYFTYKIVPMVIDYKKENRRQSKKGLNWDDRHFDSLDEKHSKTIYDLCNNLGGVYVKIGQVFGSRDDIFPPIYQKRLEPLLENAKGQSYKSIKPLIKYLEEKLDNFDKNPIGIASLGQVYRGVYEGNNIIIKVLKPNVKRDTKMDLLLTNFTLRYTLKGLSGIAKDFSDITLGEFNFLDEANIIMDLERRINIGNVYFPKVYRELCTKDVLVLEYIDGVSLTKYMKGGDNNKIGYCINKIFEIMYHQIFKVGIFSSDPHPGNFFIVDKGDLPLVVPLDFGQVGRLNKKEQDNLKELVFALKNEDNEKILSSLVKMGFKSKNNNKDIDKLKLRYAHCMFNDYMKEDMLTFNNITKEIAWTNIPLSYMLVNKAFITLSGILSLCKVDIKLIDLFILRLNLEKNI